MTVNPTVQAGEVTAPMPVRDTSYAFEPLAGKKAEEGAPYLDIRHLHKRYGGFTALQSVNLQIRRGELVCFLGPSGCGKTTLLRAIAGLEAQTSGEIWQDGKNVSELPAAQRDYGIVFQSYALFPNLTVADNVGYGLVSQKQPKHLVSQKVHSLLETVGLTGSGAKYPAQLSGGQQQRVALARALAMSPGLLLLDEPLSALDATVRVHLRNEIRALQQRLYVTTIMVTHDQEEAMAIADRVVVMNHARIEQVGGPQEVFDLPASDFVYEFLGDVNKIGLPGCPPLYVRPHEVEVVFADDPRRLLEAHIEHLFAAGPVARASLRVSGSELLIDAMITRQQVDEMALSKGDLVGLWVRTAGAARPSRGGK